MVKPDPPDRRPPLAVAMHWVTQVSTISLEMALPPVLGHWADSRWGTGPWLVSVGAIFGFAVAMLQLLKLAGNSDKSRKK